MIFRVWLELELLQKSGPVIQRVSVWILNGTLAHERLFSAMKMSEI